VTPEIASARLPTAAGARPFLTLSYAQSVDGSTSFLAEQLGDDLIVQGEPEWDAP